MRVRCFKDNKVVFETAELAQAAVNRIARRGQAMKFYRGKCGHLHLARIKQ
jgi:hypothetical protein